MKVRQWMKHPVHNVKPLDSIEHARELMERHRVNQLPVVVNGELVGIVTDRDLRAAFPSIFDMPLYRASKAKLTATDPHSVTVEMVMMPNVVTIAADATIGEAARKIRCERIGALPVVDRNKLVGIITRSDLLDCLIDLAGEVEDPARAQTS